ncbi:GNAT family N-acetyltransferase [Paenibacillus sp. FSL H7-0326]|uniref:GNAT family N-acetyltransferase n=1 Tax=Paenibacillus sp. FSL H7-0326 TaxID=1921144 RepID=UPI00096F07F8|nr:GNAT family protein [Paenibacillus sp. FSL H7-0326]OMC69179.1 GNAT family N-acetyltransferase [Paenibacillus sp. FSL H7-0326]
MYKDKEITIRPIEQGDLPRLWELIYKDENPEWKQWDAPYFAHHTKSWEEFTEMQGSWIACDHRWVITAHEEICGMVSYYYEDEQKNWLEMGIVLHQPNSWNKSVGTRALSLWIDHLFNHLPLIRVGLTTWSGNTRMIRVAEKLGMQIEGRIRKVRFYNGKHYDSIRMGMLREEWEI